MARRTKYTYAAGRYRDASGRFVKAATGDAFFKKSKRAIPLERALQLSNVELQSVSYPKLKSLPFRDTRGQFIGRKKAARLYGADYTEKGVFVHEGKYISEERAQVIREKTNIALGQIYTRRDKILKRQFRQHEKVALKEPVTILSKTIRGIRQKEFRFAKFRIDRDTDLDLANFLDTYFRTRIRRTHRFVDMTVNVRVWVTYPTGKIATFDAGVFVDFAEGGNVYKGLMQAVMVGLKSMAVQLNKTYPATRIVSRNEVTSVVIKPNIVLLGLR